jgi:hypothetical protein
LGLPPGTNELYLGFKAAIKFLATGR